MGWPAACASRPGEAENGQKRNAHFAMRNETFRVAQRKLLKSFWAPNHSFRGIVCFQSFNFDFVSPFSRDVCFQWFGAPFRFAAFANTRPTASRWPMNRESRLRWLMIRASRSALFQPRRSSRRGRPIAANEGPAGVFRRNQASGPRSSSREQT
jgi:hypothetical protein